MASYADDFNRADGPLGADWVQGTPDATQIVSNQATLGYQNPCIWATAVDTDDMFVEVTQINKPSSSWGPIVCAATSTPGGSDGYRLDTQDWQWSIGLIRNGSEVARSDEGDFHYSELPGPFVWRIEREGADVRVFLGAMEIIVWTDPSPLTGRYVGFAGGDPAAVMDDWSAGDLGAAPVTLIAADCTVTLSCDTAALVQHHALTASDSAVAVSADTGALTQHHLLTAADSTVSTSCDTASLIQHHTLAAADCTITVTSDTATLTAGGQLMAADSHVAVTCTTATLTQHQTLAGADSIVGVSSSTGALVQHHVLGAADCLVRVTCDHAVLPGAATVIVAFGPATMSVSNLGAAVERRALSEPTVNASALGPVEVSP